MKRFQLTAEDAKWLRRWLRSNLTVTGIIATLLLVAAAQPNFRVATNDSATADEVAPAVEVLDDEAMARLVAVAPQGWRKTADGWEHVSTWNMPTKSLNDWIEEQEAAEPKWIRGTFDHIRQVSPIIIGMLQLTMIALVVNATRNEPKS